MKGKIFNAQEVQAIIAGNKTMFREVVKPRQPRENYTAKLRTNKTGKLICMEWKDEPELRIKGFGTDICKCPYQVGQKIFVKESFARSFDSEGNPIAILEADSKQERKWKPAQHMKQEHSRLILEITDIKVERLGEISEENAVNEGVWNIQEKGSPRNWDIKNAFATFWNATHKKPEEKFEVNPFVWVVDFKINN